ncbi:sodium/solute symporter [Thioclava sp. GXIMD2076]|uniref:sodium:solute symporter family transporter n=1 Tax=Thioclava sp. GXIMD2076 TaxID=3131931 RepID=UPI0030CF9E6E
MESVQTHITTLDIAVIIAYLVVVLAIGIWVSMRTKTGDDLFLGGRSLAWGAIGLSLFASNISTTTIIGLTGSAYATGIASSAFEWMSGIPLIFLALIFAPLYLKAKVTTTPEWLDQRYSRKVRLYFSALTIFFTVVVETAGGLYAGGVVLTTFFPDLPLWLSCIAIGAFAGGYAATGGLKAVVYTDVIQAVILLVGCSIVAFLMFQSLDFSWDRVREALPEGHLDIVKPIDDPGLPWPGLFLGVWMLGFWYWVTNQYVVQRVLGARSLPDAQRGALFGGILKCVPLFIMVLPGAMAVPLLPDLPTQDMVFPTMITQILPPGLTGLVLAGLVAAIMSTVDSTLNSSSTLVVHDFLTRPDRAVAPEAARRYGSLCTVLFMLIAVLVAPLIQYADGIWSYLQQAFSILVPPVVAVFFLGAVSSRVGKTSALVTLVSMHLLGIILFVLGQVGLWPLHYTITVALMTIASCLLHLGLSATILPRHAAPDDHLIWTPSDLVTEFRGSRIGLMDVRLWAVALVLCMAAILIAFW